MSIKIAPNRYTRPIPVTRGMLEGGSGSPGKFTIQCAGLARAVRDLGCGVASPAGIISGLLHMDDLGQVVCDEADLRRALARVCSWLYEHVRVLVAVRWLAEERSGSGMRVRL